MDTTETHLIIWDKQGHIVFTQSIGLGTVSFAASGDCDYTIDALADSCVFLRTSATGITLTIVEGGKTNKTTKFILKSGESLTTHNLHWLICQPQQASPLSLTVSAPRAAADTSHLIDSALRDWLRMPMFESNNLREAMSSALETLVNATKAQHGLMVLVSDGEFTPIALCRFTQEEAHDLWQRMPEDITVSILRNNAKVILPDWLTEQRSNDTTVFLPGLRSMAGFPVTAEGKVLAIMYLGFDNIVADLSVETQQSLENAVSLIGIVLQRALLRQQIDALRVSHKFSGSSETGITGRIIVGDSQVVRDVYELIKRLASVDIAVHICGETGTGKELAAKELHRHSRRNQGPFVTVNAAALPPNLAESELFGHKKGSFTGALSDRCGLIEQAHKGTLFIDEIGELDVSIQAKLLRALQDKSITRVGDTGHRSVDFRLLTATHRNLPEMIKQSKFREDLYYRIAGATIRMPSLRERRSDITLLANFFRQRLVQEQNLPEKEFSADALNALLTYRWPGNVRELEHTIYRAMIMSTTPVITAENLNLSRALTEEDRLIDRTTVENDTTSTSDDVDLGLTLDNARDRWMRRFLVRSLERNEGNRARTAKALGIGERSLFRYIDQLEIR